MSSFRRVALSCGVIASLMAPALAHAKRMPPRPLCFRGDGYPNQLALRGGELELCLAGEDAAGDVIRCFFVDLTSAAIRASALDWRERDPAERWKVEVGDSEVQICTKDGRDCKTLRASGDVDPGLGLSVEMSQDGALVALSYMGDQTTVETFDRKTGKKLAEVHGRMKQAMCINGSFAGETLLVAERDCGESQNSALWFAGPDGKRIADAGGGKAFASGSAPAHLSGDDWAFLSAKGDAVAIQDLKTGKVKKKISLGKKKARAALVADDKRLVVGYADQSLGDLAVIDLATYKVKKLKAERCAK